MAFVGGGIGGQLSRRYGPKYVITIGLTLEALGIWLYVAAFSSSTTFWDLLPALMLHGIGIGFATSQLTNVVLSDIPPQKAGSASGAAGMVRQVGTALGIALIGAIFVSQATTHVRHDLAQANEIPPALREQVVTGVGDGIGGGAPPGASNTPVGQKVEALVSKAVTEAARSGGRVRRSRCDARRDHLVAGAEHSGRARTGTGRPGRRRRFVGVRTTHAPRPRSRAGSRTNLRVTPNLELA